MKWRETQFLFFTLPFVNNFFSGIYQDSYLSPVGIFSSQFISQVKIYQPHFLFQNISVLLMCCWERRRSKDVKSVSVCIFRKGDNEDLKSYEYDMNKTFLNAQKERPSILLLSALGNMGWCWLRTACFGSEIWFGTGMTAVIQGEGTVQLTYKVYESSLVFATHEASLLVGDKGLHM